MPHENPVVGELAGYVGKILHDRPHVAEYGRVGDLPAFMESTYEFHECRIAGRRCVLLVAGDDHATPAQIAKHLDLVRDDDATTILVAPSLNSHIRDRLIGNGIPFIVPGNQFYVPELGMDLRERFRGKRSRTRDALYPSAQAILFHHLLRLDNDATTARRLASRLRCTPMTVGRAFDNLVAMKLAKTEMHGRERHIVFPDDRQKLFNDALPHLRSPVRKERYILDDRNALALQIGQGSLQKAGESALALRSDLSTPPVESYAIGYEVWNTASRTQDIVETDPGGAVFILETWHYDPLSLSIRPVVDPLSLYAQFHSHDDPEIQSAVGQLLKGIEW